MDSCYDPRANTAMGRTAAGRSGRETTMTLLMIGSSSSCVRALLAVVACWYGVGTAFAEQGAKLSVTILLVDEKRLVPPMGT